jgi:hypothetical protein
VSLRAPEVALQILLRNGGLTLDSENNLRSRAAEALSMAYIIIEVIDPGSADSDLEACTEMLCAELESARRKR